MMPLKLWRRADGKKRVKKPDNTHKRRAGAAVGLVGQREPSGGFSQSSSPYRKHTRTAGETSRNPTGNVAASPQKERKCCSCEII